MTNHWLDELADKHVDMPSPGVESRLLQEIPRLNARVEALEAALKYALIFSDAYCTVATYFDANTWPDHLAGLLPKGDTTDAIITTQKAKEVLKGDTK